MTPYRKKLIEVALPLKAINLASSREKSIRHGHPSTLHLWWARRPLAACRAVLFASLVDDPDSDPIYQNLDGSVDEERAGIKRAELFNLIEELVRWENSNNTRVINAARAEIARCVVSRKIELDELQKDTILFADNQDESSSNTSNKLRCTADAILMMKATPEAVSAFLAEYAPPALDPFCGGGSIPLEAQRLGLRAYASDLNPVPVLITKALIEIPPRFAGQSPINPDSQNRISTSKSKGKKTQNLIEQDWPGATGLAEDVRYYGQWMRDQAEQRIGQFYPKVKITEEMAKDRPDLKEYLGEELTVIAWLWARTVASPNPACNGAHVPLIRSYWLSTKKGKKAWVMIVINKTTNKFHFEVGIGEPPKGFDPEKGTVNRKGGRCIFTDSTIPFEHIRSEGKADRVESCLMGIVAEGNKERVYLTPLENHSMMAKSCQPKNYPDADIPKIALGFRVQLYGMDKYYKLFTPRQLVALTTFSDLIEEVRKKVIEDALSARASRPHSPTHNRGYLPHWEVSNRPQFVTFRLKDGLPQSLLEQWEKELEHLSDLERTTERRRRIESALDAGHGECYLRLPEIASLVENALLSFDGSRYKLHAWSVMPNHVHVLFTPLHENSLSSILHSWKSFTAKEANKLLHRKGPFWQEEYFDRMIRDEEHWYNTISYIDKNPVKAGLCERAENWAFGSASRREEKRAGRPRSQDSLPLTEGGTGAQAYADAVATYLAFAISRLSDRGSTISSWDSGFEKIRNAFGRQALPMTWDFAEANPFSEGTGAFGTVWAEKSLYAWFGNVGGISCQFDSTNKIDWTSNTLISTDPPYYDNIGYADLSDYFYVWLRRSLKDVYPSLFTTALTPKAQELIASPYRHDGSKHKAQEFFEVGLGKAFERMQEVQTRDYPLTIYYAFKQMDDHDEPQSKDEDDVGETESALSSSTGWETMLAGLIRAGFTITGTWPMRTEMGNRMVGMGTNSLASSIVLVCRPRPRDALIATRKELMSALRSELPLALKNLQYGNIAPVDLAQATIGPGMQVFSRFAKVIESNGNPMSVRQALGIINQVLDEILSEQEGDFDPDTRWALAWFEQFGMNEGPFGDAETFSKAKNTAMNGLVDAGIVQSKSGKVKLVSRADLREDWNPSTDQQQTVWLATQHLIRTLEGKGESQAAMLLNQLGALAETARELAYRLYSICERNKWSEEALAYNGLVIAWPELTKLAIKHKNRQSTIEPDLFS